MFALSDEDFDKIQKGYGCPRCLEDFHGVFMLMCPVCKHKPDVADFIDWKKMPFMRVADTSLASELN